MTVVGPTFGAWLRHWRGLRGLSQLALAGDAGISSRHLSFLETGRSLPSREMVERLAETLAVPAAERNVCLLAAGYAPVHPVDDASAGAFEALERILDFVMARQTSFPALVIDEGWNIRMRNRIAVEVFAGFREAYRLPESIGDNAMHVLCHPEGLRRFMPDWARYVVPFVREIETAAAMPGSPLGGLRDEILAYPGVAEALAAGPGRAGMLDPVLTLRLMRDDVSLAFHTAFTSFPLPFADNPRAVKIESFYPADAETGRLVDALGGDQARDRRAASVHRRILPPG